MHGEARAYAGRQVLVTGAFGFLGSHVARALVAGGARVTALDIDTRPERISQINSAPGLRDAIAVETGSVTDTELVRRVFSRTRFDHVFHFAVFSAAIEHAAAHPTETLLVNSTGIVHLLAAAVETAQPLRSFLHASTDKVYGDLGGAPYSEEADVYRCVGVYEASKLAADLFARSYRRNYGVPIAIARMCNVFGPHDVGGSRLVPRTMAAIFRDDCAPTVYAGCEHNRRDYLYVDDCCRALLMLAASDLTRLGDTTPVFQVPGTANLTTEDMCLRAIDAAATVAELGGETAFARTVRQRSYCTRPPPRPGLPVIPVQHNPGARLAAHTGFRPEVSLHDGLLRAAAFYRDLYRDRTPRSASDTRNA